MNFHNSLTTLFGSAQLAMQQALRENLDAAGSTPRAPNFVVLTLRRDSFTAEYGWDARENVERLRHDLEGAYRAYLTAHGWGIGGSGSLALNIMVGDVAVECLAEARIERCFYELTVTDDRGTRTQPVGTTTAVIGRAHEPYPRGFVPVHDARKVVSREHLELTFCDLRLWVRKLGRNLTALNNTPLSVETLELRAGDRIECGSCTVTVEAIARA